MTGRHVEGPADLPNPVLGTEFAHLLRFLGPFEASPRIAVAVSGGGDSMALTLLAHDWAREGGGEVVGLTVDHGLRPGSAAEAKSVAGWLQGIGMAHHVLRWTGPKPASGVQAAARDARYRLLEGWCREAGILHLLFAHTREDQAETVVMRRDRSSTPNGLAGMAAVREAAAVRVLRPLLGVSRARLRRTLESRGQAWIDDPSNDDAAFARVRVRRKLGGGLEVENLVAEALHNGRTRQKHDACAAHLLAASGIFHPAGFVRLDAKTFLEGDKQVALMALARMLTALGGRSFGPRQAALRDFYARLAVDGNGARGTLGGCRVLPWRRRLLICREARNLPADSVLQAGTRVFWDGRFAIECDGNGGDVRIVPVGRSVLPDLQTSLPAAVRPSLPALADAEGVLAVPHLDYKRSGNAASAGSGVKVSFRPRNFIAGIGFGVA